MSRTITGTIKLPIFILALFFAFLNVGAQTLTPTPALTGGQTNGDPQSPVATTSVSVPAIVQPETNILKPNEAEVEQAPQTFNQKPSQGEGVTAPAASKPTEVPQFSLPDVVITGDNELTIGAKRLERPENDVTLGTRDLRDFNRSANDLPGLDKTITALSTEDTGSPRASALILHLGGGNLATYGGWGLFGQSFESFEYLLTGGYSNWGGEPAGPGHDGEERTQIGFASELFPQGPLSVDFSGNYEKANVELPYENSSRESHEGINLKGNLTTKLSNFTDLNFQIQDEQTQLTTWDQGLSLGKANELGGMGQLSFDEISSFLKTVSVESGFRGAASSDLPAGAVTDYQWAWLEGSAQFKIGDDWSLTTKLQAQAGGGGLDLPLRFYPSLDLFWHLFEDTQLEFSYTNSRTIDDFYQNYMDSDHLSALAGFALPTERMNEFGLKWTQKITDQSIFSIFGSEGKISGYHQWTDLLPAGQVVYIQDDSTIGLIDMKKAGVNFQFDFDRNLALSARYQWQSGTNQSDGRNLTELPLNQFGAAIIETEEKWDAKIGLQWVSQRYAFETRPDELPDYWTVGLSGSYHFERVFSLWCSVENLLGESYQLEPGYDEPRFYTQAGIELIF
jgi:hypothetical protein